MGKFIETKLSERNVKITKRRPVNLSGKTIGKALPRRRKIDQNTEGQATEKVSSADFQDLSYDVGTNPVSGRKCLRLINPDRDLFAADDLKASYWQFTRHNLICILFEEIALEGLDGITLQALWKRIENVLKFQLNYQALKEAIWRIVCLDGKVQFYELPEERQNLDLPWTDPTDDSNFFTDPRNCGNDPYTVEVPAKEYGEWGSCSTLKYRRNVSEAARQMSLSEAFGTYKNKLVLVADEDLRRSILYEDMSDPNCELMPIEYCILERIGRARELGEMSAGTTALSTCFGMDQKSIHHYIKKLNKQNLVTRQICLFSVDCEHSRMGRLIQLRRFHSKKKSKQQIMIERAVNYLKKCADFKTPYADIKSLFEPGELVKQFKQTEIDHYINLNLTVPYKEYYEGSTYQEYMMKNLSKERMVQLAKLRDPYVNVEASWVDHQKEESSDDAEDDEDDDADEGKGKSKNPMKARRIFNKDLIRDVYQYIVSKGKHGISTSELNEAFDSDFSSMRTIIKKLTARKLIAGRKIDVGRNTMNRFTATRLVDEGQQDLSRPISIQTGSSTALEKLKQRQRQKILSEPQTAPYSLKQLETERCRLQTLRPVTFNQPTVHCAFFTMSSKPSRFANATEADVFIVKFLQTFRPFKMNVSCPTISTLVSTNCTENHRLADPELQDCQSELWHGKSKLDCIMKAYLLKALMDNVKLNDKEVVDFLDPNKTRKAEKRPLDSAKADTGNTELKALFAIYMGSNPSQFLSENDSGAAIRVDGYVSNPIGQYKTGDRTEYQQHNTVVTERTLSRMSFILNAVKSAEVFADVHRFLPLIHRHETATGYTNKIDRRSLHKICNTLTGEGYLKAITIHISSGTVKKTQTFLCLPRVPLDHHVIQENLQHLKEKVICHHPKMVKKPGTEPKEAKSPFTQADVIQSLTQIQRLIPHDTVNPSKTSARCYGRRPKFARLALIHELFYYLIFEESSSTPLSKAAARDVLHANQIRLSDSELEAIPPMYCREISWKTFIHPMPKHFGWDKGWGLLGDVIMRFPLVLITRCYSVNFYSNELQELLQHPIKRFYTLKDLPVGVRTIILYRRKFLYDMISQLHLLCYCGLVQLGPSGFHEKEKMFFYMNRKATLWDTTSIKQDYTKIAEKDYPKIRFEFHRMDDVMKYWSTMNNICLHTELAIKLHGKEGSTAFIPTRSKPSLMKAKTVRTKANVKDFDTGEIPGDHLGGAGLDSSLYSHLPRSWHLFTISNQDTVPESLNSLKLDKTVTWKPSNKHFLSRPRENKHLPLAAKGGKQKKRKKINQTQPRRSIQQVQKIIFDSVDRAVIRKFGGIRYRPRWTQEEDKLLILLRMAIFFLTPSPVNKLIGYRALRDLLYIKSPKSRDKTSSNVSHRFTLLKKSVPFLSNIELIIPNLYKLEPIAKYFVPLKHFLMHGEDPSGLNRKSKVSIQELRVAFVFLGYYILNNQKDVEVALHGKFTSIDYFNKDNYDFYTPRLVACAKKPLYVQPTSEEDIKKYTLTSTILCSLSHRNDTPEWSVHNYKVWQQFTQPLLKSTLTNMKEHRMVQFFREQRKLSLAPYRLSLHFIFSQSATFTHHTMDEAFAAFIQLKNNSPGTGAENECRHLFGFNEVLSISASTARMEFNFPEHHFILNPDLEDHSEVIEELAKRYQAKLKSELKEAETLIESGARPEDDDEVDSEMPEATSGTCEEPAQTDVEVISVDDGEPMDLSINATINNLKHWISDCIDLDRVRSPSPEIFNFSIKQEVELAENAPEQPANPDCKVPSLEEIKQEMLKPLDSQEKRLVPHICDLTKLLSTTFEDIETDDRASYLMKKYFVQQYPTLQSFKVDGLETLAATLERTCSIAEKIERDWKVGVPTNKEEFEDVLLAQGIVENVDVAWDVLRYIEDASVLGATGFDLKEAFPDEPIALILIALTEHHYVMRTGICEVTFVHFKHQEAWLTKTCSEFQEDAKTSDCSPIQVSAPNWFKIKAAPWTAIDGTLDAAMLKLWLSQIFSYCIENSKIPLRQLCWKFCYLKPVDVFYLLELLEEVGALEIRRLVYATDLFSEDLEEIEDCKGSFMDRFDEMYVDSKNVGFITVGSCFQSLK
uniref:B-block binding subunit of TFIIIC domain-containing protein n=1 Tax=Dendroctonus ponderosae TaxID=77166 RepID=A0AAR5PS10_DENPD